VSAEELLARVSDEAADPFTGTVTISRTRGSSSTLDEEGARWAGWNGRSQSRAKRASAECWVSGPSDSLATREGIVTVLLVVL